MFIASKDSKPLSQFGRAESRWSGPNYLIVRPSDLRGELLAAKL